MAGEPAVTVITTDGTGEPAPLTHAEHEQVVGEAAAVAIDAAASVAAAVAENATEGLEERTEEAQATADTAIVVAFDAQEQCQSLQLQITSLSDQLTTILTRLPEAQPETATVEVEVPAVDDAATLEPVNPRPTGLAALLSKFF